MGISKYNSERYYDPVVYEALTRIEAEERAARAAAAYRPLVYICSPYAGDVEKNTLTEIALAGRQAVSKIKSEIAGAIVAKATGESVKSASLDPEFIREMLVSVAKNWNGADSGKVTLQALLPEDARAKLDAAFAKSARALLDAGIEVGWSKSVKTGFKVGAKEGGYYISFTDADLEALLGEYLREKVYQLLFKA